MNIIGFHKKIQDLSENAKKITGFPKENWHRGGTEEEENTAGRAASAIGVLRNFKSNIFAWRFFRLFWGRPQRNASIQSENDIGEELRPKSRGGTGREKVRRAASAIGVLRIFKSSIFAWRFFDFFGDVRSEMQGFKSENDIGEEPLRIAGALGQERGEN